MTKALDLITALTLACMLFLGLLAYFDILTQ
jgi:hypothetical protein